MNVYIATYTPHDSPLEDDDIPACPENDERAMTALCQLWPWDKVGYFPGRNFGGKVNRVVPVWHASSGLSSHTVRDRYIVLGIECCLSTPTCDV